MTFLDPVTGIAAALVSAPVLLLLYFLKLRRRPVIVGSTMLWSASTADLQVNVPFKWIRFSWLLVLQLLILGLFCTALARPILNRESGPADRIVLLIDRSASMSAVDGAPPESSAQRTRLEAARSEAIEIINRLGGGAEVALVAFAARPEVLTSFTRDRGMLRNTLRQIEPSDQPADLAAALRLVGAMSAGRESDAGASLRVTLLSDGAYENAAGSAGLGSAVLQFVRVGPSAAAPRDNIGIVALAAKRGYEDPATVNVFVRVQSTRSEETTIPLSMSVSDETPQLVTLRLPQATETVPGEAVRSFEFQREIGGVVRLSIGRNDALPSDNDAAVVLRPPGAPAILLVQAGGGSTVVDLLARDALEALEPRELRTLSASDYEAAIQNGELGAFDLIVFDRVIPSALPAVPSISFASTIPIAGVGVTAYEDGDPDSRPTTFAYWQRTHPVLRYVQLGSVRVDRPLRMSLPEGASGGAGPSIKAEVIASGAAGPLIVLIEQGGVRRLVVGFDLADSRWWQDPGFPIFMKNATDFLTLTGDESAGLAYTTAQAITLRPVPSAAEVRIEGPVTLSKQRQEDSLATEALTIGPLPLAGLYRAEGVVQDDRTIAINMMNAFESRIGSADALILGGKAVDTSSAALITPREVWPWFVIAAFGLLILEWVIFGWKMRV